MVQIPPEDTPRSGPCSPWVSAEQVQALQYPDDITVTPEIAAEMAMAASEVLYALSGRQFTGGSCGPVTTRPLARPHDVDTRFGHRGVPSGYLTSGQAGTAWGNPAGGAINHYGTSEPSKVDLGAYPVTAVTLVKIDGVVIPPNEYYLQDYRILVRERPSISATPTERYGWPVNQLLDLPDTQQGTFSVTYLYGAPPPAMGVRAAEVLAQQLVLNALGAESVLPQRVTSITRQGVSTSVVDVMDFFSKGLTGIYEIDLFVSVVNPTKARLRPMAWSPDVGRPRRQPSRGL